VAIGDESLQDVQIESQSTVQQVNMILNVDPDIFFLKAYLHLGYDGWSGTINL